MITATQRNDSTFLTVDFRHKNSNNNNNKLENSKVFFQVFCLASCLRTAITITDQTIAIVKSKALQKYNIGSYDPTVSRKYPEILKKNNIAVVFLVRIHLGSTASTVGTLISQQNSVIG